MTDTAGRNQPVMPPGRELDALVAEKVMGWTRMRITNSFYRFRRNFEPMQPFGLAPDGGGREVPPFSTEWDAMRLVVERLVVLDHVVQLTVGATDEAVVYLPPGRTLDGAFFSLASGDTLPHAVCLAALAALKAVEADRA